MIRKKSFLTFLLTATILTGCISGCGSDSNNTNEKVTTIENNSETEAKQEQTTDSQDNESKTVEECLADVAKLNNCEVSDLIYSYDDYGFVNFLGCGYTADKINNSEEAFNSLSNIITLAGIGGCQFDLYREDVSPVTGFTYYIFTQVVSSDDEHPIAFSNSQIRIIVDSEGNSKGFSADITSPESLEPVDETNFVEQSEAEYAVKQQLKDGIILSEVTELTYWDDYNLAFEFSNSKVIPVWLVYTNEVSNGKPYTLYVVYAKHVNDEVKIVEKLSLSSAKLENNVYTSNSFFEGMEHGGEYTYKVDMTWAIEVDAGYTGEKEIEVTVPVMYDSEAELYYLADYNEKIVIANHYDFMQDGTINAVVSDNPEDINSWHFAEMTGTDGEKYFCNANYLVSSFATMEDTYNIYNTRYGYNSVDKSGMPILLLSYALNDMTYPENEADFMENACSCGQWHDWATFLISPTFPGCVDVATMAHEFAHGINSQMTDAQYLNEMGAVMEGYADSIGDNLAYIYGYKGDEYADYVGSEICEPIRSFADPYLYNNAKYINGKNYQYPNRTAMVEYCDYGGVHSNSSVVNYLYYCLTRNSDSNANVIDMGTGVDLFVETLYCATYNTKFTELGAFLLFAVENVNIPDEQKDYVWETIIKLGFTGDRTELDKLIAAENSYSYDVAINATEEILEEYTFAVWVDNDDGYYHVFGQVDDENKITGLIEPSVVDSLIINLVSIYDGTDYGTFLVNNAAGNNSYDINIEHVVASVGDELNLEGEILKETFLDYENANKNSLTLEEGTTTVTIEAEGLYCISVLKDNGNMEYYVIDTDTDIEE